MEIGGIDIVFRVPTPSNETLQARAVEFFSRRWPACVVETDATEEPLSPTSPDCRRFVLNAPEFFVYPSAEAAASWTEHGASDENMNQMVHVLVTPADDGSAESEVTLVVGEGSTEMRQLADDLRTTLLA